MGPLKTSSVQLPVVRLSLSETLGAKKKSCFENWSLFFSGVECKDEIYSAAQLSSSLIVNKPPEKQQQKKQQQQREDSCSSPVQDENSSKLANVVIEKPLLVVSPPSPTVSSVCSSTSPVARPQTATSKIFAPRTEEMSKGFLTFSEEEPGLTSKYLPST